jgi:hypothetical protein
MDIIEVSQGTVRITRDNDILHPNHRNGSVPIGPASIRRTESQ